MTIKTFKRARWATLLASLLATVAVMADPAFRSGPGGLRIKDLKTGLGPQAEMGQIATMHFIGWLDERGVRGREIFNSRARGEPVRFVIGAQGVMEGWNDGVLGMRAGGQRMLLVPPGKAYGKRRIDDVIPENASLMFRIELIELQTP